MTRKDTIIAAVLVNAGLLIILFSTALKTDHETTPVVVAEHQAVEPVLKKEPPAQAVRGDEVDQILKQYAKTAPSEATPNPFAEDLRSIATSEPAAPPAAMPSTPAPKLAPVMPVETIGAGYIDYKVKKGDVLEKIARHHHCTVDQIMKANQMASSYLKIGQVLKIPKKPLPATQPVATTETTQYYTIKNGDNPWTIAVKHHMKLEELLRLNQLDEEKARKLKPGDQLRIR